MKTAAIFSILIGSVTAFIPSSSRVGYTTSINVSPDLERLVGASVETGGAAWDPLDITDFVPVEYARKAELANGRVAMLATVGWLWPKYVGHFTGSLSTTDPIAAARKCDLQFWAQFVALCGAFEVYTYQQEMNGKSRTPQFGGETPVYDVMDLYPKDEAKRKEMELAELKNARLAMLGIAGFAASYFIPGSVPWAPFS